MTKSTGPQRLSSVLAPEVTASLHPFHARRRQQLPVQSGKHRAQQGNSSQCVHDVISSQVERTPDAVAVQVGDVTLTYRQLDDRAAAIASRLATAGAGPGTVVAMLLDRTPDLVAAIVGILKSGAAL